MGDEMGCITMYFDGKPVGEFRTLTVDSWRTSFQAEKPNKEAKKLYSHIKKHVNKKKEYAIVLNSKTEPVFYYRGNKENVSINCTHIHGFNKTIIHNHPNESFLSTDDVSSVGHGWTYNGIACTTKIGKEVYLQLLKRKKDSKEIPIEALVHLDHTENLQEQLNNICEIAKKYNYKHKLWRMK